MSVDYCHANHYLPNGKVDRKLECDDLYTWATPKKKVRVIKSAMRGSIYYAAVEITTGIESYVLAAVCRTYGTDRHDPYFNFGVKTMIEDNCPAYYDCPKGILDLLTPTDSKAANEWREKCREKYKTQGR